MLIILNSDVLYHTYLVEDRLSLHVESFCRQIAKAKHEVILPETTLFEFEHKQAQFVEKQQSDIEQAYKLLDRYGVRHLTIAPQKLVGAPDLVRLIEASGVKVEVVRPTLEDFEEAHRRACFHRPPHPGEKDSDEMRDLVIWAIACRLARKAGGALLISRDSVHANEKGDAEAKEVALVRTSDFDQALELLGFQGASSQKLYPLMKALWEPLKGSGLPVSATVAGLRISEARFVNGIAGLQSAKFRLTTTDAKGRPVTANADLSIESPHIRLKLKDIKVGEKKFNKDVIEIGIEEKDVSSKAAGYEERLAALKRIMGVDQ
jgi:hypothetical protein